MSAGCFTGTFQAGWLGETGKEAKNALSLLGSTSEFRPSANAGTSSGKAKFKPNMKRRDKDPGRADRGRPGQEADTRCASRTDPDGGDPANAGCCRRFARQHERVQAVRQRGNELRQGEIQAQHEAQARWRTA
jgi:hypothetical protein